MKNVILYTRVSTDEQADKGFSLRYQKEILYRYCELKSQTILQHFQDDFSAKTFERPEWKKLLDYCKTHRKMVDTILFTKWDRFSRNAAEAYQVIAYLRRMGIEVNAIEQPLDLAQPDNKIMLAIYLAVPEVENDKISIRVTEGSRRANKEGCWTTTAPLGYVNKRTQDGKSSLEPSDKAYLVKEALEILAVTGKPVDEVRRFMLTKGMKISRSRFHTLIRNRVYIGQVKVPAYKNEDETYAEGLHEAIVSDQLFNRVQERLNNRKKIMRKWSLKNESFPLRGHIQCSRCDKPLTGSKSKSRSGKYYYYYHCRGGCLERFQVTDAHQMLENYLSQLTLAPGKAEAYLNILKDLYGTSKNERDLKISKLQEEIEKLTQTIDKAEDNLFQGNIDQASFNKGKTRYSATIVELEQQLNHLKTSSTNFKQKMKKALEVIVNLKTFYQQASWQTKQTIIGLTFPGKLVFKNNKCQTLRLNTVFDHIYHTTSNLVKIKKGQALDLMSLSSGVIAIGFEPMTVCLEGVRLLFVVLRVY